MKKQTLIPSLVTESTAAEILGCTTRAMQQWRLSGEGPSFVKVGRLVRYRPSDLETYVESRVRTSTSDKGGE